MSRSREKSIYCPGRLGIGFIFSGIFAILPSLILLRYFYVRDLNREPRDVLMKTFFLGVATVVPSGAIGAIWILSGIGPTHPVAAALSIAFLGAAIPEEFFKFLVLARYSARHPAFNEPMDGIVYGATASLGFATMENILYVLGGGWPIAIARAFTAVPAHACFGAVMGYFVAKARLRTPEKSFGWHGYLAAMLLHGLYDFPLFTMQGLGKLPKAQIEQTGNVLLILGMLGAFLAVLVLSVIWTILIVRRLRIEQQARPPVAVTA